MDGLRGRLHDVGAERLFAVSNSARGFKMMTKDTVSVEGPLGRAPLSPAVEDYLKAIYSLRSDGEGTVVTTQSLADYLRVAPASATNMAKKLATMGLVHHTPYRGLELSDSGERVALEIVRHHRIIETFLAQVLGLSWDKVHDEAERWEHVLSEEVEQLMMDKLGHPTRDPHGAPIPSSDGVLMRDEDALPLCEAVAGRALSGRSRR